jgi:hypothetical protein
MLRAPNHSRSAKARITRKVDDMRTHNSSGRVTQDVPGIVLSRLALPSNRYLVHELTVGPDRVPRVRLGVTVQRGGALKPLDPDRCVTLNVDQVEGYGAAVKSLLAKVRAKTSSAPAPEQSFAKQISLAVFRQRRGQ